MVKLANELGRRTQRPSLTIRPVGGQPFGIWSLLDRTERWGQIGEYDWDTVYGGT
jgi:hypothetical protein